MDPIDQPQGGAGIDAIVGLSLKVGKLADGMDDERRREREYRRQLVPVDYPITAAATFPASGNLGLGLHTPPEGSVWLLRRLYVGGVNRNVAAAGSVDVYNTAMPALAAAIELPAANLVDYSLSMPNTGTWSNRQVAIHNPEHLVVVILGGTPGQVYVASGTVESYSEAAYKSIFEL